VETSFFLTGQRECRHQQCLRDQTTLKKQFAGTVTAKLRRIC